MLTKIAVESGDSDDGQSFRTKQYTSSTTMSLSLVSFHRLEAPRDCLHPFLHVASFASLRHHVMAGIFPIRRYLYVTTTSSDSWDTLPKMSMAVPEYGITIAFLNIEDYTAIWKFSMIYD